MANIARNDLVIAAMLKSGDLVANIQTGEVWARNGRGNLMLFNITPKGYRARAVYTATGRCLLAGHRTIWISANGVPADATLEINHKNGIKHDNRLVNLELATRIENVQHAVVNGLFHVGSAASCAVLNEEDIPRIFQLAADGVFQQDIAAQFNVGHTAIGNILQRANWKHVQIEPNLLQQVEAKYATHYRAGKPAYRRTGTPDALAQIMQSYVDGATVREIATELAMDQGDICRILNRKRWQYVPVDPVLLANVQARRKRPSMDPATGKFVKFAGDDTFSDT